MKALENSSKLMDDRSQLPPDALFTVGGGVNSTIAIKDEELVRRGGKVHND